MLRILIIDDDDAIRRTLELHLAGQQFEVLEADAIAAGRALWQSRDPDIVILDLKLPDGEGTTLLAEQMQAGSQALVIMITGHHDMDFAIRAMKHGALNYIHKPLDIDELDAVVAQAAAQVRARRRAQAIEDDIDWRPGRIAGQSRAILEIHKQIGLACKSRVSVLITGESGTGKELVARAIHQNSTPARTVCRRQLLGHRGNADGIGDCSATSAAALPARTQRKLGKLELAAGGTLFLDEIGDMDPALQAKLLRVLQERDVRARGQQHGDSV